MLMLMLMFINDLLSYNWLIYKPYPMGPMLMLLLIFLLLLMLKSPFLRYLVADLDIGVDHYLDLSKL